MTAPPRARKRFGQHFLEPAWVRKVVEAIAPAAMRSNVGTVTCRSR